MPNSPSVLRGFLALVWLTVRRQWRVKALGWATFGLIAVVSLAVGLISHGRNGWKFETRWTGRFQTLYRNYPQQLDQIQMLPQSAESHGIEAAVFSTFRALLNEPRFLADYEFVNFSRWVVFALYLGFLLPLINLAFASGAIGAEREGRTLIWLLTRPQPRFALYVAKFLGVLPWSLLVSLAGLVAVCLSGGPVGQEAFRTFAPAVAVGSVAYSALFHLLGAVIRRPAVMGLAYIFFFETLVANLPGSLKQFSLNYYVRSLLFNEASHKLSTLKPESLDVYGPADATTVWLTLWGATVVVTVVGAILFGRVEPKEES
ncbi:MAG: ABC transporter permease subunit [Gemmataceae bacterium]